MRSGGSVAAGRPTIVHARQLEIRGLQCLSSHAATWIAVAASFLSSRPECSLSFAKAYTEWGDMLFPVARSNLETATTTL